MRPFKIYDVAPIEFESIGFYSGYIILETEEENQVHEMLLSEDRSIAIGERVDAETENRILNSIRIVGRIGIDNQFALYETNV